MVKENIRKEIIKNRRFFEPRINNKTLKRQYLNNYLEQEKLIKKMYPLNGKPKNLKALRAKLVRVKKKTNKTNEKIMQANRSIINKENKKIRNANSLIIKNNIKKYLLKK